MSRALPCQISECGQRAQKNVSGNAAHFKHACDDSQTKQVKQAGLHLRLGRPAVDADAVVNGPLKEEFPL